VWEKVKELEKKKASGGGSAMGTPQPGGVAAVDDDEDDDELEAAAAAAATQRARSPSAAASVADDGAGGSDGEGGGPPPGLFPLSIRGSKTDSTSLAVKPTTTMAQLVKHYCKKFASTKTATAWIEFDGEKLAPGMTVEEAKEEFDLEGEETFEIKGV
jgi:hypothetical protein